MRKRSKGEREVEEREDVLGGRRQGGSNGNVRERLSDLARVG